MGILSTAGIGAVLAGGSSLDWVDVTKIIGEVSQDDALQGRLAWATTGKVAAQMMRSSVDSGSGRFVWEPAPPGSTAAGSIAGYPAYPSSNVPSNLGSAPYKSACIFGNWQDLLIGFWGVAEILADPYTYYTKGSVRLRITWDCDTKLRHAESFAAAQDIDPTV